MKYTPLATLMLLIGIALGGTIQTFAGRYSAWIFVFLGLFLLVAFAMQLSTNKKIETPIEQI